MGRHRWDPVCVRPSRLVVPTRIDPRGLDGPTRNRAYGPRFRQVAPGWFVPVGADHALIEQRILEQSFRMRRGGAVTGWAALRWRGAQFFDGVGLAGRVRPVPIVVGLARLRPDPRVVVSQEQLAPSEREQVGGIWCTTVQRALFDEVRATRDVRQGVVAVEMAAAARLISVSLFAAYVGQRQTWEGVPFVRRVLLLATDDSRSPQETRMRLCWELDAALPRPLGNQPVYTREGRLIGVPDLFDPVAGVVGEYDGADHREAARHRSDVEREADFRNHGLEYFVVVEGDLRHRGRVAERMRSARSRAKFLAPESCAWTLTPPEWRTTRESVDDELERRGLAVRLTQT